MIDPHNLPAGDGPHQRRCAGAITRVAAAVAAGVAMGWAT